MRVEEGLVPNCYYYKGDILHLYILISSVTGILLSTLVNVTTYGCSCFFFISPFLKTHTHDFNPYHLLLSSRNQINQWLPKHWGEENMKNEPTGKAMSWFWLEHSLPKLLRGQFQSLEYWLPSYSILKAVKCYDKIKAATNGSYAHYKLWKLTKHRWRSCMMSSFREKRIHILFNNLIFYLEW